MRAWIASGLALAASMVMTVPLAGCGGGPGGDNTKFMAACLKNGNALRCGCLERAIRTSMDDSDFHKVADWIEPGKFGDQGGNLQYGVDELIGTRYSIVRRIVLESCTGYAMPGSSSFGGVAGPAKVFDESGRYIDGPNKGKRHYELLAAKGL